MAHATFFRLSFEPEVDGYFACVTMPVKKSTEINDLADHLDHQLRRFGLGRVTKGPSCGAETKAKSTTLTLSLISDAAATLQQVATLLASLHAPLGTTIGHAECPALFSIPSRPAQALRSVSHDSRGSFGMSDGGSVTLFAPHARQIARLFSDRARTGRAATLN